MKNHQNITSLAVLVALSAILSLIDRQISLLIFSFLPGIKIGLANIVVLLVLINFSFKESLTFIIIKILLISLLLASLTTFIISSCASLLSYFAMFLLLKPKNQKRFSIIAISIAGGFIHISTQLVVIACLYQLFDSIILYGLFFIPFSLLTSILVGIIVQKTNLCLHIILKN